MRARRYTQDNPDADDPVPSSGARKNEPIRPGDVILYFDPIFPAGDKRGRREATVISVDPRRKPVLVLSNSAVLQDSTQVCRTKIM